MREEYVYLCTALADWTDAELNQFYDSLRRDRSLEYADLARCIPNKNKAEIQVLTRALLSITEEEIMGTEDFSRIAPARPEAAIDILMQSSKHVSPCDFSFSSAAVETLENWAHSLRTGERFRQINETDPALNIGLRYSELYSFLAALSSYRKLPWLTEPASGAILDLLIRLVEVMKLVTEETGSSLKDSDEQKSGAAAFRAAYCAASEKVLEYVGLYLACSAVIHLSFLRNPGPKGWDQNVIKQTPIAPFSVLESVEQPTSLKAVRLLRRNLLDKFLNTWNLPALPAGADPSSLRSDPKNSLFQRIVKRMSMFALNPFGLPISVISPMKILVDNTCQGQISRRLDIGLLMSSLSRSVTHETSVRSSIPTPLEVKRIHPDSALRLPNPKRRRVATKNHSYSTVGFTKTRNSQRSPLSFCNVSSLPAESKPSDFSRKITTTKDVAVTKATYRRYFRIQDRML